VCVVVHFLLLPSHLFLPFLILVLYSSSCRHSTKIMLPTSYVVKSRIRVRCFRNSYVGWYVNSCRAQNGPIMLPNWSVKLMKHLIE
jgi:hypothetical protein